MGDLDAGYGSPVPLRIADHLGKTGVYLLESLSSSATTAMPIGRVLEELPRTLIAGLEGGGSVRDKAHFANTSESTK